MTLTKDSNRLIPISFPNGIKTYLAGNLANLWGIPLSEVGGQSNQNAGSAPSPDVSGRARSQPASGANQTNTRVSQTGRIEAGFTNPIILENFADVRESSLNTFSKLAATLFRRGS